MVWAKSAWFGESDSFLAQGDRKNGLEEILKIDDVPPIGWRLAQCPAALQPFSLVDRGAMAKNEHLRGMEPARKSSPPPVKSALERRIMPRLNLEKGVVAPLVLPANSASTAWESSNESIH